MKSPLDTYASCDKIYIVRTQGDALQPRPNEPKESHLERLWVKELDFLVM